MPVRALRALRALLALRRDAAAALLLAQICVAGNALVVNVLAARALAPAGRGELALLLQIAYLGSLVLLLGIDRSLVAVFAGSPTGTAARALLRLLLRPAGLGLVVSVVLLVVPAPWPSSWSSWLAVAALFAVANGFVRGARAVAIAADRQADYVRFTLQSQLVLLAGAALLAHTGVQDAGAWLAVYLLSAALPTAVQLVRWSPRGALLDPDGVTSARREGIQLLPASLATSGMLRIDRLLLPALASTAALGLYAGVATMTELLSWPLGVLGDARLGRWRADSDAGRLAVPRILVGCLGYAAAGAGSAHLGDHDPVPAAARALLRRRRVPWWCRSSRPEPCSASSRSPSRCSSHAAATGRRPGSRSSGSPPASPATSP